jgi:hypothetical protein
MHYLLGNVVKLEWCDFWQSMSSQSYVGDLPWNTLNSTLVIAAEGGGPATNEMGVPCAWDSHHGDFRNKWMEF